MVTKVNLHVFECLVFFPLSLDGPELFSRLLEKWKLWPTKGKI